jgi:regulatory protein
MARRRPGREDPDGRDPGRGPAADPESVARTIVLTRLTAQARSRQELADTLAAKNVPADVAQRVLDRFEAVGLVDDSAFAQTWVTSRQASRGLSRRALSYELRRKGIDDETIGESVGLIDDDAERASARRVVDQKLRATRNAAPEVRYRRLVGILARKGYPAVLAVSVVREALGVEQ